MSEQRRRIAFRRLAEESLGRAEPLVRRWLPSGKRELDEWSAVNPTRADKERGSFKINLRTGRWADFATGDRGGDLIGLAAYLYRLKPGEAAIRVAEALGVDPYE
jgi:hypothetical protein